MSENNDSQNGSGTEKDTYDERKRFMASIEIGHGPCERCGEARYDVCRTGKGSDKRDLCRPCWRKEKEEIEYV